MPSGTVDVSTDVDVSIADFARGLAHSSSEDQALFFEEFLIELEGACADKAMGLHWQLDKIVEGVGLQARDVLEKMAEISKGAKP